MQVEDAVEAGAFRPVHHVIEPFPAGFQVLPWPGVLFEQTVPKRDADVIQPQIAHAFEVLRGDPGGAEGFANFLHRFLAVLPAESVPERFFVLERDAGKVRLDAEPGAEVDAAEDDLLAGLRDDLGSLHAQRRRFLLGASFLASSACAGARKQRASTPTTRVSPIENEDRTFMLYFLFWAYSATHFFSDARNGGAFPLCSSSSMPSMRPSRM